MSVEPGRLQLLDLKMNDYSIWKEAAIRSRNRLHIFLTSFFFISNEIVSSAVSFLINKSINLNWIS